MIPNYRFRIIFVVIGFTMTTFFSCNNNYKKIQQMGVSKNAPIGVAKHINLKYTDSGRVTANLLAVKMLDYSNRIFPYNEFTGGVTLYLFDKDNRRNTVISDYAISYGKTNLIDLQGNVKIATHTKDTLFAEQLYYDQKREWIYTNRPVRFRQGADIIYGNGFDSNKNFTNAEVLEVTGIISLEE